MWMSEGNAMSRYVVQVRHVVDLPAPADGEGPSMEATAWIDLAGSIEVPSRMRRRTVVEQALRKHGLEPDKDGFVVRVLDEASATEIPVGLELEPRLRIG